MSKKIPEQDTNIFPFKSSKYDSKQNVSWFFSFNSLLPLFLESWECCLKFLRNIKLSILNMRQFIFLVSNCDHSIDPAEENLTATISWVVSRSSLIYLWRLILFLKSIQKFHLNFGPLRIRLTLIVVLIFRGHSYFKFEI